MQKNDQINASSRAQSGSRWFQKNIAEFNVSPKTRSSELERMHITRIIDFTTKHETHAETPRASWQHLLSTTLTISSRTAIEVVPIGPGVKFPQEYRADTGRRRRQAWRVARRLGLGKQELQPGHREVSGRRVRRRHSHGQESWRSTSTFSMRRSPRKSAAKIH